MANTIPLRRMVLYKHGVAFYTRQGVVEGTSLELPFRSNEVDDALKSLVAVTLDGGRITAVSYATPTPTRHNGARIVLGLEHALFDLLHSIRGTPVRVTRLAGETIEGRVLGVETHPQGRENGSTLVLLVGEGNIRQIATGDISQLEMADGRTVRVVGAYLDTVAGEEEGRALRITLDEPDRQVQVSYAVPSPVWRVSYRFVGNRDQSAALLQGWGILDNLTGEDLEAVEVTLVAGQPVSFRYDLTSSVTPQRRFVQDEARIAAGPVEFAAALPSPAGGPEERARASASYSADNAQIVRQQTRPFALRSPQPSDLADATALEASTQDLTELFEYRLGEISVGRDESAMVPVVQRELPYHSELLYNAEKVYHHPVVSLRLLNDTGLTLERGPVTIVEDGQYRGEAIVPFTTAGSELVLAYAVELGITSTVDVDSILSQAGLEIRGKLLSLQDDIIRTTKYSFVNSTNRDETVVLEQRKEAGAQLIDMPAPDEETQEARRWRVSCPSHRETTFAVRERTTHQRYETLLDQNLESLAGYMRARSLDEETRERLGAYLRLRQRLADTSDRAGLLRAEQREIGEREERLRKNLTIQPTGEQEAEIRRHSAEEMVRQQAREAAIEVEIATLREERSQLEADTASALSAFTDLGDDVDE